MLQLVEPEGFSLLYGHFLEADVMREDGHPPSSHNIYPPLSATALYNYDILGNCCKYRELTSFFFFPFSPYQPVNLFIPAVELGILTCRSMGTDSQLE